MRSSREPEPAQDQAPPDDRELPPGVHGIEDEEATARSKLPVEAVQEAEHLGHGLDREARDPYYTQMELADARLEASVEVLAREHGIEVHGDLWNPHAVPQACDACVQVREKPRGIEPAEREPRRPRI